MAIPNATPDRIAGVTFPGGGEMGERIRAFDWSKTALGPPETWPQNLKSAVAICLDSRMPIVIWWNKEQAIQFYNDAYISFLGPTKHPEFLGRSGRECWEEIWDRMGPLWDTVFIAGKATWSEDFLYVINRRLPQEEGYFTFSYSPIWGTAGAVDGLFCACYETTGKVVGGRRLETLRRLGKQAGEAGSVAAVRESAAAVLKDNLYDIPFARIYLLDAKGGLPTDAIAPQALASVLKTRQPSDVNGLEFPAGPWPEPMRQAVVLPLFSSTRDNLAGLIVLGFSPRLPIDTEYRAFFDLVAGHVSTALANARALEEERKRAQALAELDRAKTAFFSNVSHEFRTPLTLMLGPIEELLARTHADVPPAAKGQLELARRNGLRLLRLVNTLLNFSRIEAGREQALFEPIDLQPLTMELASVFRGATERAGLQLTVECATPCEPVYVDREMWEKIVLNLVSNALKFTFEGEIAITLRQVNGTAEMRVRDTGVGIPAEEIPRLFERFHRVPNVRSRTHEGSGIGLALVQELVKQHGGSVSVESKLGEGSTFVVRLPLGRAHLPPEHVGGRGALAPTSGARSPFAEEALSWLPDSAGENAEPLPRGESLPVRYPASEADASLSRLLIADDNADMRKYLAHLLGERYRVETVPDGEAALAATRARRPDLILSDIMMPRLDGVGLLRELRADAALQTVPVILLSARAGEEVIEGLQEGADDYLIKPFSARELLARVAAHLKLARLRNESEKAIRESEERLRALINATSDAVYRMSPDWTVMRYLQGREFIADTLEPSRTWLEKYIHPDDQKHVERAIQRAIDSKSNFELEHRVIRVDGSLGWVHSRAIPILDKSGNIVEWFGAASDVTLRKRAEQALKASEANFRRLIESNIVGIVITNEERVLEANDLYLNLLGRSREDLLAGRVDWVEATPPASYEKDLEAITELRKRGACVPFEKEYIRTDGRRVPVLIGGAVLPGYAELTWICFVVDLTEQKRLRDEAEQRRFDLKTKELAWSSERALREKQMELARVLRALSLGELATSIAHEVNQPLAGVVSNAEAGLRWLSYEVPRINQARESLAMIAEDGVRAAEVIRRLRDFLNKGKTDPLPIDLNAVIRETVALTRVELVKRQIDVKLELAADLPPIPGDRIQLQQVILNLIMNGAEAMESTAEVKEVVVTSRLSDGAILVAVRDSGTGIRAEDMPRVFDAFFTTKPAGMGMGLSISRSILEMHGGRIWAGPNEGPGITVQFSLPAQVCGRQSSTEGR